MNAKGEAIRRCAHGRGFVLVDDDLNQIIMSDGGAPPSQQDIMAALQAVEAELESTAYRAQRAAEYPTIGDQLDDLYKRGAFSPEMTARIKAVKDKYPKPSSV